LSNQFNNNAGAPGSAAGFALAGSLSLPQTAIWLTASASSTC